VRRDYSGTGSNRAENPPDAYARSYAIARIAAVSVENYPAFPLKHQRPSEKTRPWNGTAPGNGVGWRSQRSPDSDIISAEQHGAIDIKQSSVQLLGGSQFYHQPVRIKCSTQCRLGEVGRLKRGWGTVTTRGMDVIILTRSTSRVHGSWWAAEGGDPVRRGGLWQLELRNRTVCNLPC